MIHIDSSLGALHVSWTLCMFLGHLLMFLGHLLYCSSTVSVSWTLAVIPYSYT